MSDPLEQLQVKLKSSNLSLTNPRKTIFTVLQNQEPLTMNQLTSLCPRIDRASIYRTVKLFERLGIVQRINIGWKYKIELSNEYQHHHHHLSCLKCGKIVNFEEDESLLKKFNKIAKVNQFKIQDHQLEIQGICSSCLKS